MDSNAESPRPPRLEPAIPNDQDLARSLNHLQISTSSPSAGPSPLSPRLSSASAGPRSPSELQTPTSRAVPRSPVARAQSNNGSGSASPRSSTPTLLRKASSNSLRSVGPARPLSRKSSAQSLNSPNTPRSPSLPQHVPAPPEEEKPPRTPGSVAHDYFAKELDILHSASSDESADTVVVLHDACYGHRFSRPRTSKGALSTIVERPERIQASVLGVSMAYVRLGERHCDGKVPISPTLDPASLASVPFRILKTARSLPLNSAAVTNVHGTKWMEELKLMCDAAESKLAMNTSELKRPEINRGSDADGPKKLHEGDLYLCAESLGAFEGALGAVCEAVDIIFSPSPQRRAFVAVRPPGHHCSASYPSGFCWVNNVHVGIMHGVLNHGLTHTAIIDFDLHHGDGSQAITWAHNKRGLVKNAAAWKKTSIGYFSVHDINSYPCEWGDEEKVKNASLCIDNAHGQNIWNVHLQEWKSDVEFWRLYQSKYSILLEKTRNYLRLKTDQLRAAGQTPKAAIFLSAGFDASEWEGAGMQRHKVNVPTEFYARLTRDVVKIASEEGLGVDGRVISVLEGGYSDRALYSGVLSHLGGLAGNESKSIKEDGPGGLAQEMINKTGSFSRRSTLSDTDSRPKTPGFPYDPSWWSASELDRLDAYMAPTPPPKPLKIREVGPPPTYSSPTRASSAKISEVAKVRRTASGLTAPTGPQMTFARPPSPPPPDVPWTAAAHELSKLLIPSKTRQVNSCKHEELNTDAMKARKKRQSLDDTRSGVEPVTVTAPISQSAASTPVRASTRMSLRERKPVKYKEPDDNVDKLRRRTIGDAVPVSSDKVASRVVSAQDGVKASRQPSRRLSGVPDVPPFPQQDFPDADAVARPASDQSNRPGSALSIQTQATVPLNVKKARPAAAPRANSSRAPKKPATKSASSRPSSPTKKKQATASVKTSKLSSSSSPISTREPKAGDDLDQITTGMKKIKINVLTKEQKEARQRQKAEMGSVPAADANVLNQGDSSIKTEPLQHDGCSTAPHNVTVAVPGTGMPAHNDPFTQPSVPAPPTENGLSALNAVSPEQKSHVTLTEGSIPSIMVPGTNMEPGDTVNQQTWPSGPENTYPADAEAELGTLKQESPSSEISPTPTSLQNWENTNMKAEAPGKLEKNIWPPPAAGPPQGFSPFKGKAHHGFTATSSIPFAAPQQQPRSASTGQSQAHQ